MDGKFCGVMVGWVLVSSACGGGGGGEDTGDSTTGTTATGTTKASADTGTTDTSASEPTSTSSTSGMSASGTGTETTPTTGAETLTASTTQDLTVTDSSSSTTAPDTTDTTTSTDTGTSSGTEADESSSGGSSSTGMDVVEDPLWVNPNLWYSVENKLHYINISENDGSVIQLVTSTITTPLLDGFNGMTMLEDGSLLGSRVLGGVGTQIFHIPEPPVEPSMIAVDIIGMVPDTLLIEALYTDCKGLVYLMDSGSDLSTADGNRLIRFTGDYLAGDLTYEVITDLENASVADIDDLGPGINAMGEITDGIGFAIDSGQVYAFDYNTRHRREGRQRRHLGLPRPRPPALRRQDLPPVPPRYRRQAVQGRPGHPRAVPRARHRTEARRRRPRGLERPHRAAHRVQVDAPAVTRGYAHTHAPSPSFQHRRRLNRRAI
jgi:hypothetical protein